MFRRIFLKKKNNPICLGRWSRDNIYQESVKSIWANSDHCGDIICGSPDKVKNIINSDITHNPKKSNNINK
jgi:hypothetical protein